MNVFTWKSKKDLLRFTSRVDKKGRALISAQIRKLLKLRYNSKIFIKLGESTFTSRIDERGRFSIPYRLRGDVSFIEGEIGRCPP